MKPSDTKRRELLLGAGASRLKRVYIKGREAWEGLITLDFNGEHSPDIIWDLERLPLPFLAGSFDEIHAYDVLEHTGPQGDWRFFFDQFAEFHRLLKPGGHMLLKCPSWRSIWAWGDPSHKRVLTSGSLMFLSQEEYQKQVGVTSMSDFRFYYKADLRTVHIEENDADLIAVLQKGDNNESTARSGGLA